MRIEDLIKRAAEGDEAARRELEKLMPALRDCEVRAETWDEEKGTVEAVLSTETDSVMTYDPETWERVPEILLADGCKLPKGRKTIPLLDSHNRGSIGAILGSVRNVRPENGRVLGTVEIERDAEGGKAAAMLVAKGHLTDFSAGYRVEKYKRVEAGKTMQIGARTITGPALVATRWTIKEASLTPIGADVDATVRADVDHPTEGGSEDMKLTELITKARAGDADALRELKEKHGLTPADLEPDPPAPVRIDQQQSPAAPGETSEQIAERARKEERERTIAIRELGKLAGCDQAEIDKAIADGLSPDTARAAFVKSYNERNHVGVVHVQAGAEAQDKFRAAATEAVATRMGWRPGQAHKPAPGVDDFRNATLLDLARVCLTQRGQQYHHLMGLPKEAVLIRAFDGHSRNQMFLGERAVGAMNHSTSDFPLILADAINKRLQQAYAETQVTYPAIVNIVNRTDFKTNRIARLSEFPDLDLVNENGEVTEGFLAEEGESYALKTYGRMLSVTRQVLINDDLSAFQRIPAGFGAAARRGINRHVWRIIKTNANMADGNALFSEAHANIAVSGDIDPPDVPELAAAKKAMRMQTGLLAANTDGDSNVLNIEPALIAGPPSLETTILQLLNGQYLPATAAAAQVPWIRSLIPVIEPELENGTDYSATAWYLFADPRQYDTIELGLLDGRDAPTVMEMPVTDILGMRFMAYIDYQAKAIDWRSMYKNAGT